MAVAKRRIKKAKILKIGEVPKKSLADLIKMHEAGKLVGVFDVSNEDYHNAPGISKSGLDLIEEAPAIFKHCQENPPEPTDALEFGSAYHTLTLEPEKFPLLYAVAGPELTRRGTNDWKAFEAKHVGKVILKHDAFEKLKAMASAVREHSRARNLLQGHTELSFWWKDPDTGVLCKCRADKLPGKGVACDLKSARAVMPSRKWARDMHDYRYHVQAPWIMDGIWYALEQSGVRLELVDKAPETFVFLAQCTEAPYLVKPWVVGASSVAMGRRQYKANLKTIAECERTGKWPGYPENMELVECPDYAFRDEAADPTEVANG